MIPDNDEHREAAAIQLLVQPRLDELIAKGGVYIARKATLDEAENLCLHYFVAMPNPANAIEVKLQVAPPP